MYYLGIDLGSSSIKIALVDSATGKKMAVLQEPEEEMPIQAPQIGWAEQDPDIWWKHACNGISRLKREHDLSEDEILGIGIAYQMHGLVLVNKSGEVLRNAIIWCDSRAVDAGDLAYEDLGTQYCDEHLLNSPGNFTASKLAWVKRNEPANFEKVDKFMLPGDYIAFRMTGTVNTTISGLSEGIFWDFKNDKVSKPLLDYFEIPEALIPDLTNTFGHQGTLSQEGASQCGLRSGTPILYRAGDQPNNALSLNVFQPGEIAATGGTSGVVYAITENLSVKETARVNNFAHVNYGEQEKQIIGKLLCINGAGIQYRWLLNNLDVSSYDTMNQLANSVAIGAEGVRIVPFGNGAERMLKNTEVGTQILNLNLNRHTKAHLCRAALEGIAFAFVYGMEIMQSDGIEMNIIRAGNDNLFRSALFSTTIATLTNSQIEIYDTTGAVGAARACTINENGHSTFSTYMKNDHVQTYKPKSDNMPYQKAYQDWKKQLESMLNNK
ncbi:FGGY family carbohydrate kinase [uncultured Croceitalea sp.]|uniref:xylulokinase n=1 Tax=uncultured Croceitalea sp. TaxID=1798908 RepID=UPI003305F7D6